MSFAGYYVLALVLAALLGLVLSHFADRGMPSATGFAGMIAAVTAVSTKLGARLASMSPKSMLWGLAFDFTVIAFAISALLSAAIWFAVIPSSQQTEYLNLAAPLRQILAIVAAVLFLIYVVASRFILSIFLKSAMKKRR